MGKPVIRITDTTSHGGEVSEGFKRYEIDGLLVAGVGHKVSCPKCGENAIAGPGPGPTCDDIQIAVEGMKTACGADLIASQQTVTIE